MKAVIFDKKLELVDDYPKPSPNLGEALIKVKMIGICNTDLEITKGYMGFAGILGHEFVGTVEKINSDDKSLLGKRVVGEINLGCGICEYCQKGLQRHCPNRSTLGIFKKDGCFAEYVTLPLENLVEVPENISDVEAVFVEPLAAALEITEQMTVKSTDKVAVLGDGKLGLLVGMVLNQFSNDVILVGKHPEKLNIARAQGVKTCLLEDLEVSKEFDIVVEATGSISGFETSIALVKPRGVLVLKSTIAAGKEFNFAPIVIDEITVLGSRCGLFKPAVDFLAAQKINVKPLISDIYDFDDAIEAFEANKAKGTLKVLVKV